MCLVNNRVPLDTGMAAYQAGLSLPWSGTQGLIGQALGKLPNCIKTEKSAARSSAAWLWNCSCDCRPNPHWRQLWTELNQKHAGPAVRKGKLTVTGHSAVTGTWPASEAPKWELIGLKPSVEIDFCGLPWQKVFTFFIPFLACSHSSKVPLSLYRWRNIMT